MALVPLLAAIHGALDDHRYCIEHGAVEDVTAGDAAAHGVPLAPGSLEADDASLRTSFTADSSVADHAECPFAAKAARADGDSAARPPCTPAPRSNPAPLCAVDRLLAPPVPLLSAAPKQSPPSPIA